MTGTLMSYRKLGGRQPVPTRLNESPARQPGFFLHGING
ncbi:hypothetical protein GGD56_005307 [Rhizobium mongolense]|uniref:Uncharacterized protein n=1 Tax=Rhizobium mongolense TaxID=57676 RepID=A0ABR6IU46_9HYPH|nr:hypothetical protein [Rhizobium mongolense]